jgi:GTP-binding protein LepA
MASMENIRNFAIIAHVDHGKSTLADRLLELTHTVSPRLMHDQLLDSNPIERERGITIKLAPVRMNYKGYILNLIDTPGHVDFSYEVSRSLAACEGAVLLVDATQGIQAQTLAHYHQAKKLGLTILPVINKIDIATADISGVISQLHEILGFSPSGILQVSGKTGQGVPELLEEIIKSIPCPNGNPTGESRALVFNSNFDPHLGVLAWVRVVDGQIFPKDQLFMRSNLRQFSAVETGFFIPRRSPSPSLSAGEVGFIVTSLHDVSDLWVGDTLSSSLSSSALPGYQAVKSVVFISFYPIAGEEINTLRDALHKLKLEDSALEFTPEFSQALGHGFRVGFLGLLHADIVQERLEREFDLNLIAAAPSVRYLILKTDGSEMYISKPGDLPDPSYIKEIQEPMIRLSVFTPNTFLGSVIQLCEGARGSLIDMQYHGNMVHLIYSLPLSELIHQFYDRLKSASQGFATLDYDFTGYKTADLVRLDILIGGIKVEALTQIVPRSQMNFIGKHTVDTLKNIIPRHQFEVAIQAAIGSHVVARADVKAFRKDVIAKLSGGDQTRKDKLLKKQKAGKARLKRIGKVDIPQEAFLAVLRVE